MPDEDWATAIGNMYRKCDEVWTCGSWHMQTDRQTHHNISVPYWCCIKTIKTQPNQNILNATGKCKVAWEYTAMVKYQLFSMQIRNNTQLWPILANIPGKSVAISDRSRDPWNNTFFTRLLKANISCNKEYSLKFLKIRQNIASEQTVNV